MWESVSREVRLEIKELWVLVEQTAMSCVRWELTPLVVADEEGEGDSFPCPALAIPNGVLLRFFLFITISTQRAGVRRGVGP